MTDKVTVTDNKQDYDARLMSIFCRLYRNFGPRNWWPARSDLEMILGAILVQNVSWKNTVNALKILEENGLMSLEALLEVPEDRLGQLIRMTRYYQSKAKKLKAFAGFVIDNYQGDLQRLLSQPLWQLRQELLGVYGIGEETADSIILYAAKKPVFVIDAYTRRIFQRLGYFPEKITYRQMQEFFMKHLPPNVELYNEYHALIDCLGNRLCSNKKPRCAECPLREICTMEEL